jgi:CHAT domain-containing protein
VEELGDSVAPELRAEVYQYMGMLHFHHDFHFDSIYLYVGLAEALVSDQSQTALRARQQLGKAIISYHDWAYLEVQLAAQYGETLLIGSKDAFPQLFAELLLMDGRGAKQRADRVTNTPHKDLWLDEAEHRLRQATEILTHISSPWVAHAKNHLAIVFARRPHYDSVIRPFIDSIQSVGAPFNPILSPRDRLIAYWHRRRGRLDSADSYYARYLAHSPGFFTALTSEANYARIQQARAKGEYARATELALKDLHDGGCCPTEQTDPVNCRNKPNCFFYLRGVANQNFSLYLDDKDPAALQRAYLYSQVALSRFGAALRTVDEESALTKSLVLSDRIVNAALGPSIILAQLTGKAEHINAVFQTMEMGKNLLLFQEMWERTYALTGGGNNRSLADELIVVDTEIKFIKSRFDTLYRLSPAALASVNRLIERRNQLRTTISQQRREPHVWKDFGRQIPTLEDAINELGAERAILEFAEHEEQTVGLYIDQDTQVVFTVANLPLRAAVSDLHALLTASRPGPTTTYAAVANRVYEYVLAPVAKFMTSRDELLVIPSGTLIDLPFATLVSDTTGSSSDSSYDSLEYAIDHHAFRYIPSWRTERRFAKLRAGIELTALRVGVWTHPQLLSYMGELAEGALSTTKATLDHYIGDQSNRQTFLSKAKTYGIIHLSVHATGNPGRLHDNHLLMAPDERIDGLTISSQRISAALVVLAACSTARGRNYRREGTFSLRRSFHLAGVPDVVASLYDIPAAATARLLNDFYTHLIQEGQLPSAALAAAQRAARSGSRRAFPGYWGGIIVG